jgi:hypothetical protein
MVAGNYRPVSSLHLPATGHWSPATVFGILMERMGEDTIHFRYHFRWANGDEREFDVHLEEKTLNLLATHEGTPPDWARLEYCQCPHCPLKSESTPWCPVALNLAALLKSFDTNVSHEEVEVTVEAPERTYTKRVAVQKGLSAMVGIYMVTSQCPIMEKLKPMVRSHLPFATPEETLYRTLSMYLSAQYFLQKEGKTPDWSLEGLMHVFDDVKKVNKAMSQRLSGVLDKDAGLNALVILDCFAESAKFHIDADSFGNVKRIFHPYLDKKTP